ncbi:hypothetical protein GCM10009755_28130 [Brevibacterium samyangense]|uniref:Uncharacterized protein n=1 Tax=Brevibacterium samyangense TaxID=366888 RepID=A0ABN2TMN5_9MICO
MGAAASDPAVDPAPDACGVDVMTGSPWVRKTAKCDNGECEDRSATTGKTAHVRNGTW